MLRLICFNDNTDEIVNVLIPLIASIIAFVTSILTLAITIIHDNVKEKKHRRVIPNVSLLDKTDNIIERLNKPNARIVTTINEFKNISNNINLCISISNRESFSINNCSVKIYIDEKVVSAKSVGIIHNSRVAIPLSLENEDYKKLKCEIDYYTEKEEHFLYTVMTESAFTNRKDQVFLIRKRGKKYKEIKIVNENLSVSYYAQELYDIINTKDTKS